MRRSVLLAASPHGHNPFKSVPLSASPLSHLNGSRVSHLASSSLVSAFWAVTTVCGSYIHD